ncbi:MAG TPA: hypothetical protein VN784_14780 [Candidatus Limnocylindrales bacterium]|nr:hypothetical protein [Candidatus Limnocylindrales bacterium]
MNRQFYLDLAASGLRMPIGAHLVLHEHPDPEAIARGGQRLGRVVEGAARRFRAPLALPLMDLKLEKEVLLLARGVGRFGNRRHSRFGNLRYGEAAKTRARSHHPRRQEDDGLPVARHG